MSKMLNKPWKKLVVGVAIFVFVACAAHQSVAADQARVNPAQSGCAESQEEISEAYNECMSEKCNCGTYTPPGN